MGPGVIWFAAFPIYLVLAGKASWHEIATGALLAAIAAVWSWRIRRTSQRRLSFTSEFLRPLGRGLLQLFRGVPATCGLFLRVAFWGDHAGRARVYEFDRCGACSSEGGPAGTRAQQAAPMPDPSAGRPHDEALQDAINRARRAVAVLLASCGPDRFVVNIAHDSETVLIHEIISGRQEPDPQWLI
jgi:hypothetical protein